MSALRVPMMSSKCSEASRISGPGAGSEYPVCGIHAAALRTLDAYLEFAVHGRDRKVPRFQPVHASGHRGPRVRDGHRSRPGLARVPGSPARRSPTGCSRPAVVVDGQPRPVPRQHRHRAALAVAQVRGGLPPRTPLWAGGQVSNYWGHFIRSVAPLGGSANY